MQVNNSTTVGAETPTVTTTTDVNNEIIPDFGGDERAKAIYMAGLQAQQNATPPATDDGSNSEVNIKPAQTPTEGENNGEDKLYANNFKTIDELKKGITNLNTGLPQYILDGMSDEALEKYYVEQRAEFNRKKQAEADERKNKRDPNAEAVDTKVLIETLDTLGEKFVQNGFSLDDETYDLLERAGYTTEKIDGMLDTFKTNYDAQFNIIYASVGGKAEFDNLKAHFEVNGTAYEKRVIDTLNTEEMISFIKDYKVKHNLGGATTPQQQQQNQQQAPARIMGSNPTTDNTLYKTQAEYIADVVNPRYHSDPTFRTMVENKMTKSFLA